MSVDTGYDPAMEMPAIDRRLFGFLRGQRQHGGEVTATLPGGTYLQRIPPVITSPRIDPSGDVLAFSRYGPQVDLLAPGCRIPTYTLKDGRVVEVERSGTSFAAPLVSLIAYQLALEGLTPAQIKERLIVSADVDERVVRKSYWGGRLDAVRALSLWRDVVVFDKVLVDGTRVLTSVSGVLESRFAKISICGQRIEHAKLRQLALSRMPGGNQPPGTWRGWTKTQGQFQRIEACPEAPGAVSGDVMQIKRDDGGLRESECHLFGASLLGSGDQVRLLDVTLGV